MNKMFKNNVFQWYQKLSPYSLGAMTVLLAYCVLLSIFLFKTDFLPYVFDNNETFSSLVHAKNLYDYGWKFACGLTDESYGLTLEAHPYVYTHQGNFPRIFTYLLYCVGFRSAESNILITTFTIGLAGMWFCYHYFARYVSSLFSVSFCLFLMTDYVMFMQWQVNTWRVWHLFFFFSSLLCCHGLNSTKRLSFIFLTLLNFICLFYMEISFALFIAATCSIYFFLQKNLSWIQKIGNCSVMAIGAMAGMGMLVLQNIAHLGWEVFLQDLELTFFSRNIVGLDNQNFVKNALEFYKQNNIVFWDNFFSSEGIRNPVEIIKLFYQYALIPYSPFLTLAAALVMIKTLILYVQNKYSRHYFCVKYFNSLSLRQLNRLLLIFFLLSLILIILFSYPNDFTKIGLIKELLKPLNVSIYFVAMYVFYKFIVQNMEWSVEQKIVFHNNVASMLLFFMISACTAFVLCKLNRVFYVTLPIQKQTLKILGGQTAENFLLAVLFLIVTLSLLNPKKSDDLTNMFHKLVPFLIATMLGFLCVYQILPGYIITGYLVRYCCFTVFFHNILYAWFFYILIVHTMNLLKFYNIKIDTICLKTYFKNLNTFSFLTKPNWNLYGYVFTLLTFGSLWLGLQDFYVKEFPAIDFTFVNLFKKEPFKNKSTICNTYAAPFYYVSNNWSYCDILFGHSKLNIENKNHIDYKHNFTYLWFADAKQNSQYMKPNYFVCWMSCAFEHLSQKKPKCADLPLIKLARTKDADNLGLKELAVDTSGRDSWSIIKLNS